MVSKLESDLSHTQVRKTLYTNNVVYNNNNILGVTSQVGSREDKEYTILFLLCAGKDAISIGYWL